jgi:hypothetical protein
MVKAVWEIDRRLASVSHAFDLLLQVTPINAERAWNRFRRSRFERAPIFLYRPRPVDPGEMKRRLYEMQMDRIEDPTLQHLFLAKQMEMDRQLTMLQDLGRPQFLYDSLQLYGTVKDELLATAKDVLARTRPRSRDDMAEGFLSAQEFARRAEQEFQPYRREHSSTKWSIPLAHAAML